MCMLAADGGGRQTWCGSPYLPADERFDDRKSIMFDLTGAKAEIPVKVQGVIPLIAKREFTGLDDGAPSVLHACAMRSACLRQGAGQDAPLQLGSTFVS